MISLHILKRSSSALFWLMYKVVSADRVTAPLKNGSFWIFFSFISRWLAFTETILKINLVLNWFHKIKLQETCWKSMSLRTNPNFRHWYKSWNLLQASLESIGLPCDACWIAWYDRMSLGKASELLEKTLEKPSTEILQNFFSAEPFENRQWSRWKGLRKDFSRRSQKWNLACFLIEV